MKIGKNRFTFLWELLFVIIIYCFHGSAAAQPGKIPPFRILKTDGKIFKAEALPKERPILIIYYSPDCEHCQEFMKELFSQINEFSKVTIVMITFNTVESIRLFEKQYNTHKYTNIISGTEGTSYFVRDYYKISQTPFAALYNRQGNFMYFYYLKISVPDLIGRIKLCK